MSPASRRRSASCAAITCSANRSAACSRAASRRCSRAWCTAPATRLPDRREQPHVPVGEVAPRPRVHVQHPDEPGRAALHRHRHHRRVRVPAEFGEVPVPRVGLLARGDHGGRAVAGHPAAHPLAHGQADLPHLTVERRRRPGQRQRAAAVVKHVHEAHVGVGRLDDEPRHAGGQRPERRARRDGLDDADEQRVLPLRVGQPQGARARGPARGRGLTGTPLRAAPPPPRRPGRRRQACGRSPAVWLFTVSSPMTSRAAMARLDSPATMSPSTSLSRWAEPEPRPRPELPAVQPGRRRRDPRGQHRVDHGLPGAHLLERPHQLLARDPLEQVARRARAQRLVQVLLVVVDATAARPGSSGSCSTSRRHRSSPLDPRSRTSHSTTSGESPTTTGTASSAVPACPTTRTRPANRASMALSPSMTSSWSSTRTTRTGRLSMTDHDKCSAARDQRAARTVIPHRGARPPGVPPAGGIRPPMAVRNVTNSVNEAAWHLRGGRREGARIA